MMIEQMKPSGIDWIKDIPYSWHTNKVKYLATESGTLFLDGDWIESDVIEESGIRYLTTGNVGAGYYKEQGSGYISEKTFSDLHCLKVYPGDLMISRLNEPIGRACIVPEGEDFYVVAVDNVILRPNKAYNKKFIMYAMNTEGYAEHGNMIARGATMSRVSRSQLGQFWIAAPNLSEQTAIAEFLDVQCSKLDSIIADLEKQIDTLQKYKKSLITETVTKGLDKSVPMKDSGIEWIGQIPEHWTAKRLKYIMSVSSGDALTNEDLGDGDYPVFGGGKQMGWNDRCNVRENTILIGRVGANCGCVSITNSDSWATDNALIVRTKDYPKYVYYILQAANLNRLNEANAQPLITGYKVGNCVISYVDDREEQKNIANYLDDICINLDYILAQKQQQLETIIQHRKSLIYEYVTGKKRVAEVK